MNALIVCCDNRINNLAKVLQSSFTVYAIQYTHYYQYNNMTADFDSIDEIPEDCDILFFHTGMGDPERIPAAGHFIKEFSFNTPGTPPDIASRPNAINILRPFSSTTCPITAVNLQEFVDFVSGLRTLPPSICQQSNNSLLIAVYLLCKGYLAGLDRLNSPGKIKTWWKFVQDADFEAEISALAKSPERDRVEESIRSLKIELKRDSEELSKIVAPLEKDLSIIEQNGGFL